MNKVLEQYAKHIIRLRHKQKIKHTHARAMGIAYYTSAALAMQALINAPTPAWYAFKSKPRSAFE